MQRESEGELDHVSHDITVQLEEDNAAKLALYDTNDAQNGSHGGDGIGDPLNMFSRRDSA